MKAYYSLIQYCPDPSRLEAVNVGLVLLCPEAAFLEARMSSKVDRVRRFFGTEGADAQQLKAMRDMLARRFTFEAASLRKLEDLERFRHTLANELTVTAPRSLAVQNPAHSLDELFLELVETPPAEAVVERVTNQGLRKLLDKEFKTAGLNPFLRRRISLRIDELKTTVEVPYAFQNGTWNFIEALSFTQKQEKHLRNALYSKAFLATRLGQHEFPGYGRPQISVIGDLRNEARDMEGIIRDAFESANATFYTREELPKLEEHIRQVGHVLADVDS